MRHKTGENERLYLESLVAALTGWNDPRTRLLKAFEQDEFILFGQAIVPVNRGTGLPIHLEILVRLEEEERNLTPPGAFLPLLEDLDMMPALDRWVIRHAAGWWKSRAGVANTVLNINLAPETLDSPEFPPFVEKRLQESGVPASAICFEVVGSEVANGSPDLVESVRQLKALGCAFALTGFGRDKTSFDALRSIGPSMVKIDGSVVREIYRDPVSLAKVKSIQRVCAKAGVRLVGEFVEQVETLNLLREIGVEYAQGYGVAKPEALTAASARANK